MLGRVCGAGAEPTLPWDITQDLRTESSLKYRGLSVLFWGFLWGWLDLEVFFSSLQVYVLSCFELFLTSDPLELEGFVVLTGSSYFDLSTGCLWILCSKGIFRHLQICQTMHMVFTPVPATWLGSPAIQVFCNHCLKFPRTNYLA